MKPDEIEARIGEERAALLEGGNGGTFLDEEGMAALREVMAEVPASDPLVSLVAPFTERPEGALVYPIRRVSAYVFYGQFQAVLTGDRSDRRAQRFAEDLKRWPVSNLSNELVDVYNRLLDEARATGRDDPFLVEELRAQPRGSGYSSLASAYAVGALEACAAALAAPPGPRQPD